MRPRLLATPTALDGRTFTANGKRYAALWYERPKAWAGQLTSAEYEVATMIVAGRSNVQIAKQRCVSVRTINNQVASLYRKLGVRSRAELSARYDESAK